MDIPIQIANGTSPVIVRVEDPFSPLFYATLFLAIATGVLAFIVFLGNKKSNENTRVSNVNTRESNELLKTEMRFRMKPLLVIEKVSTSWQDKTDQLVNFHILIKNEGMTSARKIKMQIIPTNNIEIEHLVKEIDQKQKGIDLGTITSNGKTMFFRVISMQGHGHIALSFDYTYFKNETERCIAIVSILPDSVAQEYSLTIWYDQEDIEEAERQHKNFTDGKIHSP